MKKIDLNLFKIGIGSANFGVGYGALSSAGKITNSEIIKILNVNTFHGFQYIDTSPEYRGSELRIGRYQNKYLEKKIITKIPSIKNDTNKSPNNFIISSVKGSLKSLKQADLYGVLFHDPNDIYKSNFQEYFMALKELRDRNLIKKIGFSLYDRKDLIYVMEKFTPDIIQVPLNLLDQRFIENSDLVFAKRAGIEIHVRSIFLQGLLINRPNLWPPKFKKFSAEVESISKLSKSFNISLLEACLQFIKSKTVVDAVIIGVRNYDEFQNIIHVLRHLTDKNLNEVNWSSFSSQNEIFIDPRNWKYI